MRESKILILVLFVFFISCDSDKSGKSESDNLSDSDFTKTSDDEKSDEVSSDFEASEDWDVSIPAEIDESNSDREFKPDENLSPDSDNSDTIFDEIQDVDAADVGPDFDSEAQIEAERDEVMVDSDADVGGVVSCESTYDQELGQAWHNVGDQAERNSYRGMYWTGKSKRVCSVGVELRAKGDISNIDYKVTIWEVDIENDLHLSGTPIVTSETVNGSVVAAAASNAAPDDYWVTFDLPKETLLTSGKTVVLVSRVDVGTKDSANYVQVRNNYDEGDLENSQWNSHYTSDGTMAGRRAGDEDQPEYFACNMRLYGEDRAVSANTEVPNMPNDVEVTALSSTELHVEWTGRNVAVPVDHYNVYEYKIISSDSYDFTLLGSTKDEYFNHTDLTPNSQHYYVVTAVSTAGVEGYHSLKNSRFKPDWEATTPSN